MLPVQIEDAGDLWRPYMLNLLFYFPPRRRRRRPGSRTGKGAFGPQLVRRRHHAVCAWAPGDGQRGPPAGFRGAGGGGALLRGRAGLWKRRVRPSPAAAPAGTMA